MRAHRGPEGPGTDTQAAGAACISLRRQASSTKSRGLQSPGERRCITTLRPYASPTTTTLVVGSRTVNVEPCPGVLTTVIVPPIIAQKRWLIASPSPVPP